MRFNRFGGGDDDFDGGGRNQPGFSDGLVEGLLVRRKIDRQNKFDKLNEQYAKKEMEMKESEERDRILEAALRHRKMELDNEQSPEDFRTKIANREAETEGQVVRTQLAGKEVAIHQQNANTSAGNLAWDKDPSNPNYAYKTMQATKGQREIEDAKALDKYAQEASGGKHQTAVTYAFANKITKERSTANDREERTAIAKKRQENLEIKDSAARDKADKQTYDMATTKLDTMLKAVDGEKNRIYSVEEINNYKRWIANNFEDMVSAEVRFPGTEEEKIDLIPKQKGAAGSAGSDPWAKYK